MVHGYVPVSINRSEIISIPEDKRASLRDSTNYRGTTLCNAIAKVLDIYLLHRYNEYFYTSDMQYAFKESHSTVMCTAVLKEVVAIYNARGSNVYACLLDVSKAFDRVSHDKLFSMLIARHLHAIVVRIIVECYSKHELCVKWNTVT